MAGAGWRQFTRTTLASADVQAYLMDQSVMAFDSASQRTTELVEPTAGMLTWLRDSDTYQGRTPGPAGEDTGGAWRGLGRHWGTVAGALPATSPADPTKPQNGDTAYSTAWGCTAVVTGGQWRQLHPRFYIGTPQAALAQLAALVTSAAAAGQPLHTGFLAYMDITDRLYSLDSGGTWRLVGGRAGTEVNLGANGTVASGWSVTANPGVVQHHGNGMATVTLDVQRTGADITPSTTGKITNVPVFTLPTGWEARGAAPLGPAAGGNRSAFGIITALSRVLTLTGVTGTAVIATGATISLTGTYALAAPQDLNA